MTVDLPLPATHEGRRRAVILDRDGTLIDFVRDAELGVVTPAFHPKHVRFLPGVLDGLRVLRDAGFGLAVATNQPQAAKGELPVEAILATNEALAVRLETEGVPVLAIETCLHHPTGGEQGDAALVVACGCRKPAPGMLTALAERFDLDLGTSFYVGDTPTDLRAARAAGMRAGLVMQLGRCELCPGREDPFRGEAPDVMGPTLLDVARAILSA